MDIAGLTRVVGEDAVCTSPEDLDALSHDAWAVVAKQVLRAENPYRAEAIVRVARQEQIVAALTWANRTGTAITPRGLGSAVTGASVPVHGGVVLDLSNLTGPPDIDATDLTVSVPAGTRGIALERELGRRGYTLAHSPQSLELSSVGGWLATRATGQFSSKYGGIEDLVVGFTAVLPTGEVVRLPDSPRASIGPDLRHLFLGAEGTLGVVTRVSLKIFPQPEHQVLQSMSFPDVASGVAAMRAITRAGLKPFLVRCYDPAEAPLATGESGFDGCAMFLGSDGVRAVAEAEMKAATDLAAEHGGRRLGPAPVQRWLEHRFDYAALEELLRKPGGVAETIEVAHFWSGILELYAELTSALAPLAGVLGHFSHVYPQGTSLYLILLAEEPDAFAAEQRLREIWDTAMRICLTHGAAIAHHHGVGLARLPYAREAQGGAAPVLGRVKKALDPNNILNPGKLGLP